MSKIWNWAPWFAIGGPGKKEHLTYRIWKRLNQSFPGGSNADLFSYIETTEWDLLIILDACRYDTLLHLVDALVIESAISPASSTPEFLQMAHEARLFDNIVYVSANPQTSRYTPSPDVDLIDVSKRYWDESLSTVRPGDVYDVALEYLQQGERVVAHTIQPHYPHIHEVDGNVVPVKNGLHPKELDLEWDTPQIQGPLANGQISLERARRSYEITSDFAWNRALSFTRDLLAKDYSVAITSDHGELFGERGFVEHPVGIRVPSLFTVPWVYFETESGDGSINISEETDEQPIEDRLRALGYVD